MILLPHIWLLAIMINYFYTTYMYAGSAPRIRLFILDACIFLIYAVLCICLHLMPCRPAKSRTSKEMPSFRLKVMLGGRKILRLCFWGICAQLLFYVLWTTLDIQILPEFADSDTVIIMILIDLIVCCLHFYLLILNGSVRILAACRSLGIWKRIVFICFLWIPVIHLFPLKYLSRRAKIEYDAETCRFENRKERDGSLICATRYPIIMLHGIGFRDFKYFNYWGRIPKELVRNGAIVYYGHQEAWGTIENNAEIIREKTEEILKESHCDKVNIIAHSKGGLDARYLISGLHMEGKIASLTTMSTPHRGSELLNLLNKLPDNIYHLVASLFDKSFGKAGDRHPDCYHSSKQLSPSFCREFNEKYPDAPGVYYQSYASVVKHTFGDPLLWIPNLIMFFAGAPKNDGLVSEESAKWGNFKGTFVSKGRRGISHGDMIDLKREDYKGFDVIEAYVKIVAELKEMGY